MVSIDVVLIVFVNMSSFQDQRTSFLELENGRMYKNGMGNGTETGGFRKLANIDMNRGAVERGYAKVNTCGLIRTY